MPKETFRRYLYKWCLAAFRPAYDFVGGLALFVGVVFWAWNRFAPSSFRRTAEAIGLSPEAVMSDLVWGIPVVCGLAVFVYRLVRAPYEIHLADSAVTERERDVLVTKLSDAETIKRNMPVVLLEFQSLIYWPDGPMKDKQMMPTLRTIEGVVLDVKICSIAKGAWSQSFRVDRLTVDTVPQEILATTTQWPREPTISERHSVLELVMVGTKCGLTLSFEGLLKIAALEYDDKKVSLIELPILITYRTSSGERYGTYLSLQFYSPPRKQEFGSSVSVHYDKTEPMNNDEGPETLWL